MEQILLKIWDIGWPGIVVAGIFLSCAAYAWWLKKDDLTYRDWVTIVAFWFVVACILKIIGLAN